MIISAITFSIMIITSTDTRHIDRSHSESPADVKSLTSLSETLYAMTNLQIVNPALATELDALLRKEGLNALNSNSEFYKRYSEGIANIYAESGYSIFCRDLKVKTRTFTDDDCFATTSQSDSNQCFEWFIDNLWASHKRFEARRFSNFWQFQECLE